MSEKLKTVIIVIGIDIGKNSFHVCRSRQAWCNRAATEMVTWPGGKHGSPTFRPA
jgi:hypothetical protein